MPAASASAPPLEPYIHARVAGSRLLNESIKSNPLPPNDGQQPIQVRIDASSTFSVSLSDLKEPNEMQIQVTFKAVVKAQDTGAELIEYAAQHLAQFRIFSKTGFDNWLQLPPGILEPYFSVANLSAVQRAERALVEMGMHGVKIPQPLAFELSPQAVLEQTSGL